ncbi:MAG: carbohydrate ABC transporter permease [Caldilineaceae bacterium]|nr:carbohydrate ABC transporter permease [Caldilineaceae bacterium]
MSQHADAIAASAQTGPPVRNQRLTLGRVFTHACLMLALLIFVFPFYWMVSSSLKPLEDIYIVPVPLWPTRPSFSNYLEIVGLIPSDEIDFRGGVSLVRTFLNSTIIAVINTAGNVFLASLAGYAFAKLRFKGRNVLFLSMLATMMIPNSVGLVPNYLIMAWLKWINTWYPLIIPGLATPFAVFWMRQYMTTVPDEMIEVARIDGCGPFATYLRVVAPVVLPGMAALAIFSFIGHWNAFMGPLIYLNKPELYTLPLFLAVLNSFISGRPTPLHLIFTASFVSILPILLVFLFAQRYFIAGLTAGSLK